MQEDVVACIEESPHPRASVSSSTSASASATRLGVPGRPRRGAALSLVRRVAAWRQQGAPQPPAHGPPPDATPEDAGWLPPPADGRIRGQSRGTTAAGALKCRPCSFARSVRKTHEPRPGFEGPRGCRGGPGPTRESGVSPCDNVISWGASSWSRREDMKRQETVALRHVPPTDGPLLRFPCCGTMTKPKAPKTRGYPCARKPNGLASLEAGQKNHGHERILDSSSRDRSH
ncbi:hypothetical protein KM043_012109 [Ampulex compressa]|nr:hypothetical protein KM043_012109 [Ampulex compressa]